MTKPPLQGSLLHVPVLAAEVLSALHIFPDGVYFDGTIGVGGLGRVAVRRAVEHQDLLPGQEFAAAQFGVVDDGPAEGAHG